MQAVVMTASPPLPYPLQFNALSAPPQGMPAATSDHACLRLNAQMGRSMAAPCCDLKTASRGRMEIS